MNKVAYILGVKLALHDAGLPGNSVDELVKILQEDDTVAELNPDVEVPEAIGAPKDDHRTYEGSRAGNIDSDITYSSGLDIRGPSDTSI